MLTPPMEVILVILVFLMHTCKDPYHDYKKDCFCIFRHKTRCPSAVAKLFFDVFEGIC
ncbi:hypothetical protein M8C21_034008 [Ambrosia artemisiifolia]|uniref:Uncharacterized protein n=1 Tax=Ambrosia artemisiifolia TaxID=4212 RepID=A0AAD5GAA2_AMBAR|nr:hypothetical protein M8C21_034008 [Ambrosia artemisiifolia]